MSIAGLVLAAALASVAPPAASPSLTMAGANAASPGATCASLAIARRAALEVSPFQSLVRTQPGQPGTPVLAYGLSRPARDLPGLGACALVRSSSVALVCRGPSLGPVGTTTAADPEPDAATAAADEASHAREQAALLELADTLGACLATAASPHVRTDNLGDTPATIGFAAGARVDYLSLSLIQAPPDAGDAGAGWTRRVELVLIGPAPAATPVRTPPGAAKARPRAKRRPS
jgi:hypothetical protein